jgi:uncharacterized protein
MATKIQIILEDATIGATLDDSQTALAIAGALPLEGTLSRWGDEVYFTTAVKVPESPDARQDMRVGELGYWPVGAAFCIFFGPTPVSTGQLPRAYTNVNPFGKLDGDPQACRSALEAAEDGQRIQVRAV